MNEIEQETKLPIELEEIYSWMAFVSSRQNPNISVANRFLGLQLDEEYKIRGLASRREDMPPFVTDAQLRILQFLSREKEPYRLAGLFPEVLKMLEKQLSSLNSRGIPVHNLLVTQTLSRELSEYRVPSPAARAASPLQNIGKDVQMGQKIQFVYNRTEQGALAWDLPKPIQPSFIDTTRYKELLFRALYEVLQPLGVTENVLRNWMFSQANYLLSPGSLHHRLEMPLFANLKNLAVDII